METAAILKTAMDYYNEILANKSDPRVANLLLMKTPTHSLFLCFLYMLSVLVFGPKFMENRKPFHFKKTITTYNVMQVITSGYIFYQVLFGIFFLHCTFDYFTSSQLYLPTSDNCIAAGWLTKYGIFKCHSVDFTENTNSQREIRITHIYFLSKFTEFFDTIFFVLRKKSSQVTFLHVYHHVSMPLYTWMITKFYPGGSLTVVAFLNSFVHVVMYSYYLLAGLGPHMHKYLWWKKYITKMQLVQFATGVTHFVVVLFSSEHTCNISKTFIFVYIGIGTFFYILFNSFYNKNYKNQAMNTQTMILQDADKIGFCILNNNDNKMKCP